MRYIFGSTHTRQSRHSYIKMNKDQFIKSLSLMTIVSHIDILINKWLF